MARSWLLEPNTRSLRVALKRGLPMLRSSSEKLMPLSSSFFPFVVHAGQHGEEVVGEDADTIGEDTVGRPVMVRPHGPQPADQRRPFGSREREQLRLVEEHLLRCDAGRHVGELIVDIITAVSYTH